MEESEIVALLTAQAKGGAVGFEPAHPGEPRTLGIGDMPVEEIHSTVVNFLAAL
jgi:hypothetical protein